MRHYVCDEGQGYLYGRPMPAHDFTERYISSHNRQADVLKHK